MTIQLMSKTGLVEEKELNNISLNECPVQELIDNYMGDNNEGQSIYRQELIERGKDNIYTRIIIKKACRNNVAHQETIVKETETTKATNKELLSYLRKRFLTAISLLDRLQLEWLRHDVRLKR